MRLIEISVFRSTGPCALWCALTVHDSGGRAERKRYVPTDPQEPDFATGAVLAPPLPGPPAEPSPPPHDLPEAELLTSRLLAHVRLDGNPSNRWYLMAEPEEDGRPDELWEALRDAFTTHACHLDAIAAVADQVPLKLLCSRRTLLPNASRQPNYYPHLLDRISELARQGLHAPAITRRLQQEGFTLAPGRDDSISLTAVQRLLRENLRPDIQPRSRPAPAPGEAPGTDEWWLQDLATELSMPAITLYSWVRRGWVTAARKESRPPYRWIVRADPAELGDLRERRSRTAPAAPRKPPS